MGNYIDRLFFSLIDEIKGKDKDGIYFNMFLKFKMLPIATQLSIQQFFNQFQYWWKIEIEYDNYEMLRRKAKVFDEHIDELEELYKNLKDYKSKYILFSILNNFYNFDFEHLKNSIENIYKHYFDLDLMPRLKDQVFVDVGAFIGDSVLDYIDSYGEHSYKKMYCYEISEINIEKMEKNLKDYPNISIIKKAVTDKKGKLCFDENIESSANKITENGRIIVNGVSLDDEILESIDIVKMDIEGGEYKAIEGMKEHIKKDSPILLISVYHNNTDLFEIPKLILKYNNNYDLHLRYYGGPIFATEIVLIAIPKNKNFTQK